MPKQNYQNSEQDRRLKIVEGHIATINEEMGDIKVDIATVRTDVHWLKKYFWIVIATSVGALIGALINLIK